jgi:predicted RNA binding protein YcfA (HicA-like mRNA interferase family)
MSQKNRGKKGGQTRTAKKPGAGGGGADKTFGMKNKKGKAAQKVVGGPQKRPTVKKKEEDPDLASFIRTGYTKPKPTNTNAVVIETPEEQKKSAKANPFIDLRRDVGDDDANTNENGEGVMNGWDEAKLLEVVNKKMEKDLSKPTSEKLCQYFIKAIEDEKYGWFWECPNGSECTYRHALPPDYVFKSKEKKKVEERTLEEIIEERRSILNVEQGTPVNENTFKVWKEKKLKERADREMEALNKRKKDIKAGTVKLTGREILTQKIEDKTLNFEEENEEAFDLSIFLREKTDMEEQVDKENFNFISTIQNEFSDYKEPTEEELKKFLETKNNTVTVSNENNTVTITTENSKIQVGDASLFDDDNIDDIEDIDDV